MMTIFSPRFHGLVSMWQSIKSCWTTTEIVYLKENKIDWFFFAYIEGAVFDFSRSEYTTKAMPFCLLTKSFVVDLKTLTSFTASTFNCKYKVRRVSRTLLVKGFLNFYILSNVRVVWRLWKLILNGIVPILFVFI